MLIAAAFCMYNRYVDGLGTVQPDDEALYRERGSRVARDGYVTVSEEYLAAHANAAARSRSVASLLHDLFVHSSMTTVH